jgi:hypothetical protein
VIPGGVSRLVNQGLSLQCTVPIKPFWLDKKKWPVMGSGICIDATPEHGQRVILVGAILVGAHRRESVVLWGYCVLSVDGIQGVHMRA